jgi:hypothetical protein
LKCEESISNDAFVDIISMPLKIVILIPALKSLPADKVGGSGIEK